MSLKWFAGRAASAAFQEGNIGLMKAVTRATADQARTIRIPVHMIETINKDAAGSEELGRPAPGPHLDPGARRSARGLRPAAGTPTRRRFARAE